jgi:hypothetical protein
MQSGYKTLTPIEISNALWALDRGKIKVSDLRTYFACFALVAIREAARRSAAKRLKTPKTTPRYRVAELKRLTGLTEAKLHRSLRRLARSNLLAFSESEITTTKTPLPGSEDLLETLACRRSPKRPIPVPRAILRFLAKAGTVAIVKAVVGYLVRGLSFSRTGEISGRGTVKASWIASALGISERAVRYARRELIELRWISADSGSTQRKLNRDGAYFVIDLEWKYRTGGGGSRDQTEEGEGVASFAPPEPQKSMDFAPPIEDKKTSNEGGNTRELRSNGNSGFCRNGQGDPSLSCVKDGDLRDFGRLEALYAEAVAAGWIAPGEASALNFISAAIRAREVGEKPPKLFVAIVRRRLWSHITQAQEDHAHEILRRFREKNPDRFRLTKPEMRLAA